MRTDTVGAEGSREWVMACDVQRRFMEHLGAPAGELDYSARCRQIHELGGDCYDFVLLAGQRLALVVGDASGKGLAAALMIANVQSSVRTAAALMGDDGAAVLRTVNRQVYGSSLAERYATLFYGVFDLAARTLRYVNAGHIPPMVLRRDGAVDWLEAGGAPVGMFPDWMYEEGCVGLEAGDRVVAYTDGVVEALDPDGNEWGTGGLRRAAAGCRSEWSEEVVQAVFRSMGRQTDDATVAVLRLLNDDPALV
jgi:sigma-B regulation protein RsbU (phosphoserine phosphatase)